LLAPANLESHVRSIGMLPVHRSMTSFYEDDEVMSVFCRQVGLSGSFPQTTDAAMENVTEEMLSCLRREKTAEAALRSATEQLGFNRREITKEG
jgi:hypothetical protein